MKKLLTIFFVIACFSLAFSQAAMKPTIMFVPSDVWCTEKGFMMEFDNQGKKVKVPDYKRAVQESSDLKPVIAKLNDLMIARGFSPKVLEQSLKTLEQESAEDAMTSKGGGITESPIDKLRKTAKADIWIYVTWKENIQGPKKSITITLEGIDAYTDGAVSSKSATGQPSFSVELPLLLESAVLSIMDNFNADLMNRFEDMFANGREVTVRVKKLESFEGDLESEYEGKELKEIIENWVSENTVRNKYNPSDATENMMLFEQVRIPLFDVNNKPTDTEKWLKGLQKMLKEKYQIPCTTGKKGLGQAFLLIGQK